MADTTFIDRATQIQASWLNDVNTNVYKTTINSALYGVSATASDNTSALNAAINAAYIRGGGTVVLPNGSIKASQIILKRFVVLAGQGVAATELFQISGSNQDFIISENFAVLTGTGATVSGNSLVPSWFGLKDLRVSGNKAGNSSGRPIAWYGAAQLMLGEVLVYDGAGDNIYTEYSNTSGSAGWQGQEEGHYEAVFSRSSGGVGWRFHGPHNSHVNQYIGAFNADWGFVSASGALYDGGLDSVGMMHTYANGGDKGVQLGEICRVDTLITDGDNLEITASNVQINKYRGFNMGGARNGLVISGNSNTIDSINATGWTSSTGRDMVTVSGIRNVINSVNLVANNGDNNAFVISGSSNKIKNIYCLGFSGAGRIGMNLSGSKQSIEGEITGCATAFNYTAGSSNQVVLEINTSGVQVAVAGSTPGSTDRFNIKSTGTTVGSTSSSVQSAQIPLDTTAVQNITFAHGLLYTPTNPKISISLLDSTPTATNYEVAYIRVNSANATNITVGFKLSVAGTAGTLGRIGAITII